MTLDLTISYDFQKEKDEGHIGQSLSLWSCCKERGVVTPSTCEGGTPNLLAGKGKKPDGSE